MKRRSIRVLLFASLLVPGHSRIFAQEKLGSAASPQGLYAMVPDADRQAFRTAVETLIRLDKSGDWGAVFERFYYNDRAMKKEQFIKERLRSRVVAFIPQRIYYVPTSAVWVVNGCAVFSPPPPMISKQGVGVLSGFTARQTANGWRFDAPPAIVIHDGSPSVQTCAVD